MTNITGSLVNIKENKVSTIQVQWNAIKQYGKTKWLYGVYYGTNINELFSGMLESQNNVIVISFEVYIIYYLSFVLGPKCNTSANIAILNNIESCTSLMIDVGIIGPNGIGPLSKKPFEIITPIDPTVPPKDIRVEQLEHKIKPMIRISWKASCYPIQQSYKVKNYY